MVRPTSGWGLGFRCQDNKAEALVVFALQSDVKALWPRGLDGVGSVDTGHLGRGVDECGGDVLGLLTDLLLLVAL